MEIKPFKEYEQLLQQLLEKGMLIPNPERALRKLSQVGYYRLGTFWYPCREIVSSTKPPYRSKVFLPDTNFDEIFKLYLFDKQLRLLLLDAIERIEIALKTKVAHTLGRQDTLAYLNDEFINQKQLEDFKYRGISRNAWKEWLRRQEGEIRRCKEGFIVRYNRENEFPPIWVAVETWSLGTISKYYEMLKGRFQNSIAKELGVNNAKHLVRWLQAITILRNRCAHHTRIWNQLERSPLKLPTNFSNINSLEEFTENERKRLFSLIIIIGFLVKNIGPSSNWLVRVLELIEQVPDLPIDAYKAMGIRLEKLKGIKL